MSDLIITEKHEIARRQILVVECDAILSAEQRKYLRNEIQKQMQSGLVILPNKCRAITCDADALITL